MGKEVESMIKKKRLFLLDIDGTIALGEEILPGAREFLKKAKERGFYLRYMTNNSSKAVADYMAVFKKWGILTTQDEFVTAGSYARDFLKNNYQDQKVLVVASDSYCKELKANGIHITKKAGEDVACVLTAYDTDLTYKKLSEVCRQLCCWEVPWFATNPDLRCPIDFGMVPDCGSICKMIEASVDKKPEYIGKPAPGMVYACMKQTGCTLEETVIIGDRIYTDMECGKRAGIDSCLVLTGETTSEEWKEGFQCSSLGEMATFL